MKALLLITLLYSSSAFSVKWAAAVGIKTTDKNGKELSYKTNQDAKNVSKKQVELNMKGSEWRCILTEEG